MKSHIHQDDWLLQPEEVELLANRTPAGRLGFSVLLKFFQAKGRFPEHRREIPRDGLRRITEQLGIDEAVWSELDWEGRTFKRHRAEIRARCSFRESDRADMDVFRLWLMEEAIPQEQRPDRLHALLLQKCLHIGGLVATEPKTGISLIPDQD